MKITIERNVLLNVLKHTTGIVERRNTIPILSNVLISANKDNVTFVTSDCEIEISECVNANVQDVGSVTIPSQTLFDIVRKIKNDDVIIETKENGQVSVSSGRSKFKLSTLPVEDFPVMPANKWDCFFSINSCEFGSMLDRVKFAISIDEARYYLSGIYIHTSGDVIKCVATDGHRLSVCETKKPENFDLVDGVIIPHKTVNEIRKILDEFNDDITISINKNKISFMIGDLFVQSKLIDGQFPDYERIVPKSNEKILTVEVLSLVNAVDRVSVVSNEKTKAIKLDILPDELCLTSGSNGSDASDFIEAEFNHEPMDIGFNSKYLLDVLQQIKSKNVSFMIGEVNAPVVINDDNALFVLMPMRV